MEEQEAEFQVVELPVEIIVNPVTRSPRQPRVVALDMHQKAMEVSAVVAVVELLIVLAAAADTLAAAAAGNTMGVRH
jgi:hypothetical protein